MSETKDRSEKPKRIWLWTLLAAWIAAILATLGSVGAYLHAPAPDGTAATGQHLLAFVLGYCAASAVLAGVITWVVFFMAVFSRRATIAKSLLVLPILVGAAFILAAPVTFLAFFGHVQIRQEAIEHWNTQNADRVHAMHDALGREIDAAGDLSLAHLQRQADIDTILAHNQRVLALYEGYRRQIEDEFQRAEDLTRGMDLTDSERAALLEQFQQRAFNPLRAEADLNLDAARRRTAMVVLIQQHKDKWTIQGGQVAFYDDDLMQRVRAMAAEYDALVTRINAMRATPADSAPPPPQ